MVAALNVGGGSIRQAFLTRRLVLQARYAGGTLARYSRIQSPILRHLRGWRVRIVRDRNKGSAVHLSLAYGGYLATQTFS